MADKHLIIYFIEDVGQKEFIQALVERIAREEAIPANFLDHKFHYATKGRGYHRRNSWGSFRNFIADTKNIGQSDFSLLVVAFDGNCKGHNERKTQLERIIRQNHPFKGRTVYAVPDPHIERWYIMDQRAFRDATGIGKAPQLPGYKCKKNYYKRIVHEALRTGGINSLLGGAEYAEKIVFNMSDLYALGTSEPAFADFIAEVRRMLRQIPF